MSSTKRIYLSPPHLSGRDEEPGRGAGTVHGAEVLCSTFTSAATADVMTCAGGAALLWSSTVTSLGVLPLLKAPQQRRLYLPLGCAYLGGAVLYLAGKFVGKRQARAEHQ